MKKRGMKYASISIILVMAMFLSPVAPAIRLHQVTTLWEKMKRAGMPMVNIPTAQAEGPQNSTIYLPLLTTGAAPVGPPAFEIMSPANGGTISGMMYFAVQPTDAATVSSVTFKAGSTDLGTDSDGSDGFNLFLNASDLPAGTLELSAIGTGVSGETTKRITVNVVPNPPSSATVGSEGGVLASEIGSVITLPPGAVPDGTNISVTEMTQQEVTNQNGFDWDAMGVTFLGAQKIESTTTFSLPLGVASAGFGNRVQPGQTVVNYRIAPDANGDGVDELIVVNTASVAPNGDVISDPVPQIQLGSATTRSRSGSTFIRHLNGGISGPPGTTIKIRASGLNPASIYSNVAIWTSLVDGQTFEVPGIVLPDAADSSIQIFSAVIPPLATGAAKLMLRNESTGSTAGPIDVTIASPLPLSKPAAEIIDDFLGDTIAYFNNLPSSSPEEASVISEAVTRSTQAQTAFEQLINGGLTLEQEQALNDLALIIENSDIYEVQPSQVMTRAIPTGYDLDAIVMDALALIGAVGAVASLIPGGQIVGKALLGVAGVFGIPFFLCRLVRGGRCFGDLPSDTLSSACSSSQVNSGSPRLSIRATVHESYQSGFGGFITGMGAAPPPGGNSCGNVIGSDASILRNQRGGGFGLEPGRFVIKVLSSGSSIPFSGVTDAGGYFFIPLIPEAEPFTAIAFDTTTGETRTFEGIGPPTGESVFMFFDFLSEGQSAGTPIEIGDVINGEISEAGELDIYSFSAQAGQQVYFDGQGTSASFVDVEWRLLNPQGTEIFSQGNFSDAGTYTLQTGGTYTLLVFGEGGTTSTYQFQLWNVPPPDEFTINIGNVISDSNPAAGAGNIETPGVSDIYRFEATAGQQVYFDGQGTSASFVDVEWRLLDPQGTDIFNQGNFSDAGSYTLQTGGTYTLLVFGEGDTTSTYQFQLWNVPPADEFTINIGDLVSDGNPAAGAGNIETPGVTDIYRFEATAGQQVYFDGQGTSASFVDVEWRLLDPQGTEIFNQGNFSDAGSYTLQTGGTYTLLVFGEGDTTSTYQFQLWNVPPPDEFTINIGDVVSDGNPATGAGNIETPGVSDIYRFEATAGQQVYFDGQGTSASFVDVEWRLLDSQGTEIFNRGNFSDHGPYTLDAGGTYSLFVDGDGDTTSTYQFQIRDKSQVSREDSLVPIAR